MMNKAVSNMPACICILFACCFESIKLERRSAVTTGLYNSIVIAAFNPPFITLNGKNAESSNSIIISLG